METLVQMPAGEYADGLALGDGKSIDHRRPEAKHGGFDGTGVRRLLMDEFALHTGHRYTTVATDADSLRVL